MASFVFEFECENVKATEKLAAVFAELSKKGDTYALWGTLGVGKSVFARAFIKKLTGATEVPSPTFTLVQIYDAPEFEIYHYDFYRLKSEEEIWELNIEEALYTGVTLIEWPEKMGAYLPCDIFRIEISADKAGRRIFKVEINSEEKKKRLETLCFSKDS